MIDRETINKIDETYWRDHQVDGILFNRVKHPHGYGFDTGADNAIFTGFYLAAASFQYGVTKKDADLVKIEKTIDGLHLLTHISGTPGVLARLAFPLEGARERIGYDVNETSPTNTWTRRRLRGSMYESDTHFYYTRTTRDQLTGVVFGLSVAWKVLNDVGLPDNPMIDSCKSKIQVIVRDLTARLKSTNWSLEDHTGESGKITATKPLPRLKGALLSLDHVVNGSKSPSTFRLKLFYRFLWLSTFYYFITPNMFVWNLRITIAFSLWINESDSKLREGAAKWLKRCGSFVRKDDSAYFVFLEHVTSGVSEDRIDGAQKRLDELSVIGHRGFFAWQKWKDDTEPAGDGNNGNGKYGPGVDVLLPYWIRQYYLENKG